MSAADRYVTHERRSVDPVVRERLDTLERAVRLLAAHLGLNLDQLDVLDSPGVRRGYPATWRECEALGEPVTDGDEAAA